MAWVSFKIGNTGEEKTLTFQVQAFSFHHTDIEQYVRNIEGDIKRALFKILVPSIQLTGTKLTLADFNMLNSLKSRAIILNFIFNNGLEQQDVQVWSTGSTTVTLPPTSAAGLAIEGVWLTTDPTHAGTNYYTGGSYNPTTREISLGAALPGAQTQVLVNYTYASVNCTINSLQLKTMSGKSFNYWLADITLQGA